MNESILKALMRLFAIIADVNKLGYYENERDIVMDYLDRQYSSEIVQKYIEYFDNQVQLSQTRTDNNQNSVDEAKIIALCNQINVELEQELKLIVLIYLLDFINRGDFLTKTELHFITTVANTFKIKPDEFENAKAFTFGDIDKIVQKDRLLYIDANEEVEDSEIKHFPNPKIEGRIVVLQLPSTNTFVFRYYGHMVLYLNGHNIKPNRSYIWSVGSVIKNSKIGSLYYSRMAGRFIQANVENKFVFTADEIEYSYRNSTNGIKKFNFTEDSGRLIGIIGGSGSGKSTLLNVLNGNIKPKSGTIKINGFDIHKEKEKVKGVIGFVPQDDLLIKELSVFQNLYFNARLCFSDYCEDDLHELVERALIDFDLVEARDLNVGDAYTTVLSGGQRKRLNIALELIREPSILFVDEPTSGLSSADSEKVINLLKRQTFKGKLIIANIHQPSSDIFKMLDKLLVMDQGGRIIYYGNPIDALMYFKRISRFADAEESECLNCGNINTDQILRIVESRVVDANGRLTRKRKTSPQQWYEQYLKNIDVEIRKIQRPHDDIVPKNNFKIPGHFRQFKIFLQRDVLAKYYNKQYLLLNMLEAPLLAVILGFFTKKYTFINSIPQYIFGENPNIPAFLFMSVIVALFLGLVISAEEIFKDRKILKREKFLNLSRGSYLFSKITILFIISAIQMLIFVLIANQMLEIQDMTFRYWLILFTTSCWANMVGLNISSGLNSVVTIYILVPLILVPQLLFSGVIVDFDKMHNKVANDKTVPFIGDLMTSRWSYEALMVTQFKDNEYQKQFYSFDKNIRNTIYYKSFCIPELEKINLECSNSNSSDTTLLRKNLEIIKNEIFKICIDLNLSLPNFSDSLNLKKYSSQTSSSIGIFLKKVEKKYITRYNKTIALRDQQYEQMVDKTGSNDKFLEYKQKHYNKQLANILTNENEMLELTIQNNEIIRLKDAVFRDPSSNLGRAHYYAPVKRVSNWHIDTFWFNLLIIWIFSGLFFIILYYDILRKVISYFEILRLNRINRRRLLRLLLITEQLDKGRQMKRR